MSKRSPAESRQSLARTTYLAAAALLCMAGSCSGDDPDDLGGNGAVSGVFGGAGGQDGGPPGAGTGGHAAAGGSGGLGAAGDAGGDGGRGGASGEPGWNLAGRCSGVAPSSDPLIDDFEDGDDVIHAELDREGGWYLSTDGSSGTVFPEGALLPRADGGGYALNVTAEGFAGWGVTFGAAIRRRQGELSCPYNASNHAGIGFRARGHYGEVELVVSVSEVVPVEFGGVCDPDFESCWDTHRAKVYLAPEWVEYRFGFNDLSQFGWGKRAALDAGEIVNVSFAISPMFMPVDFWIDDVRLLTAEELEPDDGYGGAGGSGGEAGEAGLSGGAGRGEGGGGGVP